MNKIKNLIAVTAFSLLVLGLPSLVSAQWGGNDRYNNNRNIKQNVKNLKNRAKSFEKAVDRDNGRYNDRNRRGNWGNSNDNLENLADQFENATKRLEKAYGNGKNLNNSRDEARRVLNIASQIDRMINNNRRGNAASHWNSMRNDLSIIAQVYGQGYNNRGNNRNRNGNGNWRNNIPFPLPF